MFRSNDAQGAAARCRDRYEDGPGPFDGLLSTMLQSAEARAPCNDAMSLDDVLADVIYATSSNDRCREARARDDLLASAARRRIASLTAFQHLVAESPPAAPTRGARSGADHLPCRQRARVLEPTLGRFERYREALPYARAAADMHARLGATEEDKDKPVEVQGITRLPVQAASLCKLLRLKPGTIQDTDLRDETTGFRAVLYRDESTGRLILVARDTQPTSLVDWRTNTSNGQGEDTAQYAAMRRLAGRLRIHGVEFDVAGYSKGGGLAQEAALVNPRARAYVFNAAGLHENSVERTGARDFQSLERRTQSFSSNDDFLTYMNDTQDPVQQIENCRFLRRVLEGKDRWIPDPLRIDHTNPQRAHAHRDPAFQEELAAYFKAMDGLIERLESDHAAGRPLRSFPPVRAAHKEVVVGSDSWLGNRFGAHHPGANYGKLLQHQISNVLGPMEKSVEADRKSLEDFLKACP